jgi:hypothetical protein
VEVLIAGKSQKKKPKVLLPNDKSAGKNILSRILGTYVKTNKQYSYESIFLNSSSNEKFYLQKF